MEAVLTGIMRSLNSILFWIVGGLLITMTVLVLFQVFTRYALGDPSDFTEEIVRYLLIWTGFFGAAYAFVNREHMALVYVRDKLPEPVRRVVMIVIDSLIVVFAVFVMTIGGTQLAISAQQEYSALLGISRGLVYSVGPIAGAFIVVIQLIHVWEDATDVTIRVAKEK